MHNSWNDYLLIGIDEIDEQHKKLVSMLDSLSVAIRSGSGADEVRNAIQFLANYAMEHFATEKRYMGDIERFNSRNHLDRHDEFTTMVEKFAVEADENGPTESIAIRVKSELLAWLIDHIGGEDKNLARFISMRQPA
jgi:hemerythrin